MKDYNDAIAAVNGTNAENFFNRGNVYLNQEQFDQAHEDFNQAIQLDKNSAKLYHAKGLAYQSEAEKIAKKEPRDL
jgi:Tfp pilus assembly protein PilF